jgi:hypothetical protein
MRLLDAAGSAPSAIVVRLDRRVTATRDKAARSTSRGTAWSIFAAFTIATLARGTGTFMYDAKWYWEAAQSVVGNVAAAPEGFWRLRGALTALVYTPASALASVIGPDRASFAVLLQNAAFLAWFAAFLLPALIQRWRPISTRARVVGAFLAWVVVAGFAPYPLVDIYPAVACVAIVVLLRSRRRLALTLAGVLGGVSANLRPAYIVTVALLVLVAVVWRRWSGLLVPVGVALAIVPQVVLNRTAFGAWSAWPLESGALIAGQARLASYTVRYDTLFAAAQPQQFYCSPAMARELVPPLPASLGELATTMLGHVPTSAVFSMQKAGAALHWPLSTPYTTPAPGLDALYASAVTVIAVVGIAALIRLALRGCRAVRPVCGCDVAAIAAIAIGAIVTLVSATTESRFALPLVLLGVIGCTTITDVTPRRAWVRGRSWIIGTLVVALVVSAFGYAGLAHPAPPGAFDQATCASS